MNKYFINDARKIGDLKIPKVDLVITSPPYFDMKDYGSKNQIGFGQTYDNYLNDLGEVFNQCFKITKDTGSMWMIVDILRKNGQVHLLPFDVINKVRESEWLLQDILIWKKDKTVPFAHRGQMRNIFEYVLFFSKTKKFKFYPDRITTINDLKEWWPKYPERYSPKGKSETNIWDIPIPLQGSWGTKYIKHFCPLPGDLIERIIDLCSDIDDVVLDPFAGSGAVLASAHRLNRKYIGSDLNEDYRNMFLKYLKTISPIKKSGQYEKKSFEKFFNTIEKLRLLKFPKKIYLELTKNLPRIDNQVLAIVAQRSKVKGNFSKNKFISGKYFFIVDKNSKLSVNQLQKLANIPPCSKYGIESEFAIITIDNIIKNPDKYFKNSKLWRYDNGVTFRPGISIGKIGKVDLDKITFHKTPPIYSQIEVNDSELNIKQH